MALISVSLLHCRRFIKIQIHRIIISLSDTFFLLYNFFSISTKRTITLSFMSLVLQKMKGHLRLLNIACAAKAKWRQITLQKPSRDSPLFFSLLGGSDKGFGIFVETVEIGSKAAEAGLKRGDQVRSAKVANFKHPSLK